jgi:hypothetical protein
MPDPVFKTIELRSWGEIHEYAKAGWLFRGQRVAAWPLKTSLERCCDRLGVPSSKRRLIEKRIIREFRRAYHQFAAHVPDRDATLEWLGIMQHHGAPTRLLDFTYSIYVAAYFAVEEASAESASVVWAINAPWATQTAAALLRAGGKLDARRLPRAFTDDDEKVAQRLFMDKPFVAAAWPISPFRLNERLRVQEGAFLVPGDASKSFALNLAALSGGKETEFLLKIVIPESLRHNALKHLWAMNISRAALFPGLDGFARTLGINHSLFDPTQWARSVGVRATRPS